MKSKLIKNLIIVLILAAAVIMILLGKSSCQCSDSRPGMPPAEAPAVNAIISIPALETNKNEKNSFVQSLPRLVDLGAGKCIPCKMMAPILDDIKKTYAGKLDVEFIDVWQDAEAGQKYGIRVIPTQIFFAPNGKELFRHEGFFGKEDILDKWKELGF